VVAKVNFVTIVTLDINVTVDFFGYHGNHLYQFSCSYLGYLYYHGDLGYQGYGPPIVAMVTQMCLKCFAEQEFPIFLVYAHLNLCYILDFS
jgi:hypothetical protein